MIKIINILIKNLRTVSRNWNYFVILFVCPVILILLSGVMLHSNNLKNSRIGIIDENPEYSLDNVQFQSTIQYYSIEECLYDLANKKTSACVHILSNKESNDIDIYLDSTEKRIENYVKQSILESMFRGQSLLLEKTSEQISDKILRYSASIEKAKNELKQTQFELEEQEKTLQDYKTNLSLLRNEFYNVYYPIKRLEPSIKIAKNTIKRNNLDFQGNISKLREISRESESSLRSIKTFLFPRLNQQDYNYVAITLDALIKKLQEINTITYNIESAYPNPDVISLIEQLDIIIEYLDATNSILEKIDLDLSKSISKTQKSKQRVLEFENELNDVSKDISQFSENLNEKKLNVEFKKSVNIREDPVFVVFPFLIALIITFTSIVLSNMFVLKQVNQASYLRDIITPTKDRHFLIADYLVNVLFISIQALVLILIYSYWFGSPLNLVYIISAILLASSVFICLGMTLAYLIKNQSLSMLISIFLVMLALIFSDLLVPASLSGSIVRFFISINPFMILSSLLTDLMVLQKSFFETIPKFMTLGFLFFVLAIITFISKKVSKEDALQ